MEKVRFDSEPFPQSAVQEELQVRSSGLRGRTPVYLLLAALVLVGVIGVLSIVALQRIVAFSTAVGRTAALTRAGGVEEQPLGSSELAANTPAPPRVAAVSTPDPDAAVAAAPFKSDETSSARSGTLPLRRCSPSLRLVGSVVRAAQPHRSLAAVQVQGGTRVLRVGGRIGDLTLVILRPHRAFFRDESSALCVVPVYLPGRAAHSPPASVPSASKQQTAGHPSAPVFDERELREGVRTIGADTFAVSRALLERAFGLLTSLRRTARFRVKQGHERAEGIQLVSLKKDSPLHHLGLQKGDVMRKLNGLDLTDPAGALEAWTMLRTQGRLSLALDRGGSVRTLTYILD